jgi:hypothetical protein
MKLSYGTCQAIPKKDLALYPYELACLQIHMQMTFTFDDDLLEKTFFNDEASFHLSGFGIIHKT